VLWTMRKNFRIAIASDLVRLNLSIDNFLRRGQQEDLNSMSTILNSRMIKMKDTIWTQS